MVQFLETAPDHFRWGNHDKSPPDFREEIDIVRIDPLLLERQRSRYASRGAALLILLNGLAALILLAGFSHLAPATGNAGKVVAAMLVFGSGAVAGLASTFFCVSPADHPLFGARAAPLEDGAVVALAYRGNRRCGLLNRGSKHGGYGRCT